jgi:hypothetical protein
MRTTAFRNCAEHVCFFFGDPCVVSYASRDDSDCFTGRRKRRQCFLFMLSLKVLCLVNHDTTLCLGRGVLDNITEHVAQIQCSSRLTEPQWCITVHLHWRLLVPEPTRIYSKRAVFRAPHSYLRLSLGSSPCAKFRRALCRKRICWVDFRDEYNAV